ncbi:type VI secretion protein [Klebsiella quasipneumoniae subsp. similipneumoniae]|nr:type VI secretion protein [Klebsiella quasipneumoniae]OON36404.1 type VI secretion protein [Klebsiella pneumoniae]OVT76699.1 type VI secretion protein [Klebsiella quasipneumoniae subsp. similipneumoniae]OVV22983.1 type VI secretion protein [Klebsiella quasipneumoniae subsp. similipneumoniae]PLD20643.1 type VI secretion protein [Klebsiella quasipneumoniae]
MTHNRWRLLLTPKDLIPARRSIIEASQPQLTLHPLKEK